MSWSGIQTPTWGRREITPERARALSGGVRLREIDLPKRGALAARPESPFVFSSRPACWCAAERRGRPRALVFLRDEHPLVGVETDRGGYTGPTEGTCE